MASFLCLLNLNQTQPPTGSDTSSGQDLLWPRIVAYQEEHWAAYFLEHPDEAPEGYLPNADDTRLSAREAAVLIGKLDHKSKGHASGRANRNGKDAEIVNDRARHRTAGEASKVNDGHRTNGKAAEDGNDDEEDERQVHYRHVRNWIREQATAQRHQQERQTGLATPDHETAHDSMVGLVDAIIAHRHRPSGLENTEEQNTATATAPVLASGEPARKRIRIILHVNPPAAPPSLPPTPPPTVRAPRLILSQPRKIPKIIFHVKKPQRLVLRGPRRPQQEEGNVVGDAGDPDTRMEEAPGPALEEEAPRPALKNRKRTTLKKRKRATLEEEAPGPALEEEAPGPALKKRKRRA